MAPPIVSAISVKLTWGMNGKATVLLSTFNAILPGWKTLPASTWASSRLPLWIVMLWAATEISPESPVDAALAGSPAAIRRVEIVTVLLAVKLSASMSQPPLAVTLALASTLTVSMSRVLIFATPKSRAAKAAVSMPALPVTSSVPVIAASGARTVVEFTCVTPAPAVIPVESVTTRSVPLLENLRFWDVTSLVTSRSPEDSAARDDRTVRSSRFSNSSRLRRTGVRRGRCRLPRDEDGIRESFR